LDHLLLAYHFLFDWDEWLFDQKDAFSQESSPSIYNVMDREVRQVIWVAIAP
jgi:hypothetical protein